MSRNIFPIALFLLACAALLIKTVKEGFGTGTKVPPGDDMNSYGLDGLAAQNSSSCTSFLAARDSFPSGISGDAVTVDFDISGNGKEKARDELIGVPVGMPANKF